MAAGAEAAAGRRLSAPSEPPLRSRWRRCCRPVRGHGAAGAGWVRSGRGPRVRAGAGRESRGAGSGARCQAAAGAADACGRRPAAGTGGAGRAAGSRPRCCCWRSLPCRAAAVEASGFFPFGFLQRSVVRVARWQLQSQCGCFFV